MNRVRLGIAVLLALVLLSSASAWLVRSETSRLLNELGADCDELDSELSEARMWIQRLSESEMPFWWNIL